MAGIFISYRREDTQGWVGRLADGVQRSFPLAQVFYDLAAIRPGEDFTVVIDEALASCTALLALIGPRWLTAEGRRRIDDPGDFVRLEIAAALARPIMVVPVLFGGAKMPTAADLPEALQLFARRQAHEVTDTRWQYDCDLLLRALGEAMDVRPRAGSLPEGAVPAASIRVGEGLVIKKARVRDIAGMKVSGDGEVAAPGDIEVARNARIEDAEVGDIVGIKTRKKESE